MLFISHASQDADLAEALTDLIEKALDGVSRADIRCSSLPGYQVPPGDNFVSTLSGELKQSLVIGLLTPRSIGNTWVLMELGAAWGLGKPIIPLLHHVGPQQMPEALFGTVACDLTLTAGVADALEQIGARLGWRIKSITRFNAAVQDFLQRTDRQPPRQPQTLCLRRDVVQQLPWSEVIARTRRELFVFAWSGVNAVSKRTRNVFRSLLQQGRTLNYMVMDPGAFARSSAHLQFAPVCSWDEASVVKDIGDGLEGIRDLQRSLTAEEASRLHVRTTDWLMTWSGLAIDPDSADGLIQMEGYLYHYGRHQEDHLPFRPNIIVTPASELYEPFHRSIREMWDGATALPAAQGGSR